jgi:hypothetical protein
MIWRPGFAPPAPHPHHGHKAHTQNTDYGLAQHYPPHTPPHPIPNAAAHTPRGSVASSRAGRLPASITHARSAGFGRLPACAPPPPPSFSYTRSLCLCGLRIQRTLPAPRVVRSRGFDLLPRRYPRLADAGEARATMQSGARSIRRHKEAAQRERQSVSVGG